MQYDKSFKEEAVRLSDEIGLKNAAAQLGVSYYTLSGWRQKRNKYGKNSFSGSGYKTIPGDIKDQHILDLKKENAELKRSNEILQEALGFFAVRRKK
ncbi:MAG: transposase [Lacrimispora celerecrescens]|nr:transposase [Lacrimispora celerecrescens]